ncbi:MAG: hypothetical protein V1798_04165 [Pseudomonadota bacterium]
MFSPASTKRSSGFRKVSRFLEPGDQKSVTSGNEIGVIPAQHGAGFARGIFVFLELEIRDGMKRFRGVKSLPLVRRRCAIGSAMDNDLVILDTEIPPYAGILRISRGRWRWSPQTADALARTGNTFRIGPYELRTRISRLLRWGMMGGILAFAATWLVPGSGTGRSRPSRPAEHGTVASLPVRGDYGNVGGARAVRDVEFEFDEAEPRPVEIHFSPGNISAPDQVAVELNGQRLGFASVCPGRWGIEGRLREDGLGVRIGRNRLRFVNLKPELGEGRWGVRNVYVTHPKADLGISQDAGGWLRSARESFERRFSRPGELWKARQYVEHAIQAAAAGGVRPPLEIVAFKTELEQEERSFIRRGLAKARAALSLQDRKRAKALFKSLRAEFMDPSHPRRRELEAAGRELGL